MSDDDNRVDPALRAQVMKDLLATKKVTEVSALQTTKPQVVNKFCAGCGNKLEYGFKFCPGCGTNVNQNRSTSPTGKDDLPIVAESSLSLLEQVMNNKEEVEEESEVDPALRKQVLEGGVNLNVISGLLGR